MSGRSFRSPWVSSHEVMVIHDLDELRVPMLDGLAKLWNGKSKNRIDDLDGTPPCDKTIHI